MTNVEQLSQIMAAFVDQFSDVSGLTTLLNTASITRSDTSRKIMGDIKDVIGVDATRRLLSSMDTAGATDPLIKHAIAQLNSSGLDLTDQDVRDALDAMAAQHPLLPMTQADADAVKAIGIWSITPLEERNIQHTSPVTEAEVSAAIVMYQVRELWRAKQAIIEAKINDGTITDMAGVIVEVSS